MVGKHFAFACWAKWGTRGECLDLITAECTAVFLLSIELLGEQPPLH
jgi:hypothetical protein